MLIILVNSKISIKPDHAFENFEYSPALKIGLSESIKRLNILVF